MLQTERQVKTESLLDTNVLRDFTNCMQVKKTDKLTEVMLILLCCADKSCTGFLSTSQTN